MAISITILLVDDQPGFRRGVRALLEAESDLSVVGEAGSGSEALDLAERLRPDVVLMDVMMPGMNGMETTRRLRERDAGVRVIGFSLFDEPALRRAMREAGAVSFVAKAAAEDELAAAIRSSLREA